MICLNNCIDSYSGFPYTTDMYNITFNSAQNMYACASKNWSVSEICRSGVKKEVKSFKISEKSKQFLQIWGFFKFFFKFIC